MIYIYITTDSAAAVLTRWGSLRLAPITYHKAGDFHPAKIYDIYISAIILAPKFCCQAKHDLVPKGIITEHEQ